MTTATTVQLELSENRIRELDDLARKCDLADREDLFNHALTLFAFAIQSIEAGCAIASIDETEKRYRLLDMPAFRSVRRRADET